MKSNIANLEAQKCVILTNLEPLKFDFHKFLHFLKAEIDQNDKIQSPKMVKMTVLELLDSPKLVSRKICIHSVENS